MINFSSVPNLLNIINLSLLSVDFDNSFKANITALDIKNIIPKYNPIKVTNAPNPTVASAISNLVLYVNRVVVL